MINELGYELWFSNFLLFERGGTTNGLLILGGTPGIQKFSSENRCIYILDITPEKKDKKSTARIDIAIDDGKSWPKG